MPLRQKPNKNYKSKSCSAPQKLDLKSNFWGVYLAKYDLEFKLKIVIEYINGTGGFSVVGKRNGISRSMVRDW
ncbi:helix-turn-helix domain-containing protein, partial [Macrococcoides goetzii]